MTRHPHTFKPVEIDWNRKAGLLRPIADQPATPTPDPSPAILDEELLTDDDVMAILKVSRQWLADHRTRIEPVIPHIKLGREIRYLKSDIMQWLRDQRQTCPTWERDQKKVA